MRKAAAAVLVTGALGFGVSPAAASAPSLLAQWPLDEGSGQVAADATGHGSTGQLGSSSGVDAADPVWTTGHDGRGALAFDYSAYVTVPDTSALEPAQVSVDAWVKRAGTPGQWRYVVSKGSVACDRTAYGLYSGWSGGMAFYISSSTTYIISPEVSPAIVWDGNWHHVIGSYDGATVRLWVDDRPVGAGTPTTATIAYASAGKGVYLGMYRGSCDLGFAGAIDDVGIWAGAVAPANPGPPIDPVAGTPSYLAVGGGSASQGNGAGGKPSECVSVRLNHHAIKAKHRTRISATVRRGGKRLSGVRVEVSGTGVRKAARTNRKGTARITVRAHRPGSLRVHVPGQCSTHTVHVTSS
jgi:hypothetical protein